MLRIHSSAPKQLILLKLILLKLITGLGQHKHTKGLPQQRGSQILFYSKRKLMTRTIHESHFRQPEVG